MFAVFTFHEIMQLVCQYTGRKRPIIPVPWTIAKLQGALLERLPPSILTLTRDQVGNLKLVYMYPFDFWQVEQLQKDNVVPLPLPPDQLSLEYLLRKYTGKELESVHQVLPKYLR